MTGRKRRKRHFTKLMQKKLVGAFALVLFILLGLNLRIAYITAKNGDNYAKQVLSQKQYDSRTIPYKRGEIQDRNGNVFAKSEKVYNLILDCKAVNDSQENAGDEDADYVGNTVDALVTTLGVDEAAVRALLTEEKTRESQYQILRKEVTLDEKKEFEKYTEVVKGEEYTKTDLARRQQVVGVWFEDVYIRSYPMKTVASNVIGFSNDLGDGITGLEAYYSDILSGVNGREFGYLDENSDLQRTIIEPQDGNTIVSTIDMNIQQIVEKYIAEFDVQYGDAEEKNSERKGAKNVGVILAAPNTGEILAMASNHGYDLTDPFDLSDQYTDAELGAMTDKELSEVLNEKWYNYCISESYEPGSTFKPITVSSALDCGAVTQDDIFYCDGGEFVTDRQINCDNIYGHGEETLADVIKNSCNDGLMQIGMKMQITPFLKYQRLFNFGSVTGIDLPNENTGILYNRDNMHEVELATNTFGQTFTCTMIQEMMAFCAVVNGGYYYQPHMVRQILDENGGVVKNIQPVLLRQPVSRRSSDFVLDAMEHGVLEGTGKKARVPGYRVAGKTGTAEKIDPKTGQRAAGKYLVSFIGCAPVNDPQIAIYVVVDEPNVADQSTGGYAMVIARKIMMEVLPYLNIPMTEEITDQLLMELELSWEDVQSGRNAVLYRERQSAQQGKDQDEETPQSESQESGTQESGTQESETQESETQESESSAAPNPNLPAPLEDNGENRGETGQDRITNEELGIGMWNGQG